MHLVLGNGRELNSKGSEISVVQQLIEALDIRGVTFTLYEQIEKTTAEETQIHSRYSQIELNKKKVWKKKSNSEPESGGHLKEWVGLKGIIKVKRRSKRKGILSEEIGYFINSREACAGVYFEGIRTHWEIENSLHWVKDVTFGEDASKIRTNQAPENLSTFRNMALNIFRRNGYNNMAESKRLVANNIRQLCKLII